MAERRDEVRDDYNQDITEQKFLKTKPTCFIILGKPGCGKSLLAKRLSQLWRCKLLNSTQMIAHEIENKTELGKELNEQLMRGELISTKYVVNMIRSKMETPEIAHYGYVLEGLPNSDYDEMNIKKQLKMIKQWKLNPDFVINIKMLDEDLKERRSGMRTDPTTGEMYVERMWKERAIPPGSVEKKGDDDEEEEMVEDGEGEEEEEQDSSPKLVDPYELDFPFLDTSIRDRLVCAPEHFSQFSDKCVDQYQQTCIAHTENFVADHSKLFVIELDGNEAPSSLLHQLITKLETYPSTVRRAVVPQPLMPQDGEEDEETTDLPEDVDTDELLRTLAGYQMPVPAHRWRRSKWHRYCPVALRQGDMIEGKPQHSVGFLDKMYVMSTQEAAARFIANPRPYLALPLPVIPCKIAVCGHLLAGKSALATALAHHYKGEVINLHALLEPRLKEEAEKLKESLYESAVEEAIKTTEEKYQKKKEAEGETAVSGMAPVDGNNAEVLALAATIVQSKATASAQLPPDEYVARLKEEIEGVEERRRNNHPDIPAERGGWVLDDFPRTSEEWRAMQEAGIIPDQCLVVTDLSTDLDFIRHRYYLMNKTEIDESYCKRLLEEKQKELNKEKAALDELEKAAAEKAEAAEEGAAAVAAEPDEKMKEAHEKVAKLEDEIKEGIKPQCPPGDAIEFVQLRKDVDARHKTWQPCQQAMDGPINVMIKDVAKLAAAVAAEESADSEVAVVDRTPAVGAMLAQDCIKSLTDLFSIGALEFTAQDGDEEEEDMEAMGELQDTDPKGSGGGEEEEDDEGEEEEEDEEAAQLRKRWHGTSKHYDVVFLKERGVLVPGDAEITCKHMERIYTFANEDNRDKFTQSPHIYLDPHKPLPVPPTRLIWLGVRGSGKTTNARWLADKHQLFHIQFRERLQELIMPKTGRRMGPEHEEEKLLQDELRVTIDEAVADAIKDPVAGGDGEEEDGGVVGEGEDDEEKFDFTPDEEAIYKYLVEEEPLPTEILDNIIPMLWNDEPYKSTGFILEGFPRTADECEYLRDNQLLVDGAVKLDVGEDGDEVVTQRLLPDRFRKWKRRTQHKEKKKRKVAEAKAKKREELMKKRREEIISEKMRERSEEGREEGDDEDDEDGEGAGGDALPPNEIDEDELEEEIDNILQEEFPEEEEEEDEEETEEDAEERMRGEIGEQFGEESEKVESVCEQMVEMKVPLVEVPASRKLPIVRYYIGTKLHQVLTCRVSLFEKPYPMGVKHAAKLINSGYKHLTTFAYWDPVELHKGERKVVPPLRDPLHRSYACVYRHHVYFLSTPENLTLFMQDPLTYIREAPPIKPVVPVQLAVVGPPKSGKTTLSTRFAQEYGLVHISIGKAVRRIIAQQGQTQLAKDILRHLYSGAVVPDQLAMRAVVNMMLDTKTTTRGYVLDDCPMNKRQCEMLRQLGVVPVRVVRLNISPEECLIRAARDRLNNQFPEPLHDSGKIMAVKYGARSGELDAIEELYRRQHDNCSMVDAGELSRWKCWSVVEKQAMENVELVQDYVHRSLRGEAGRLASLCISPPEFQQRVGVYKHYCPVALNSNNELVDCSDHNLDLAVEYKGKYYKCSTMQAVKLFLDNPDTYVPPGAIRPNLPEHLPRRLASTELKNKFPAKLEMAGFCPVAYLRGNKKYTSLVEGEEKFAVEYMDRLFVFSTEYNLDLFMRKPDKFANLKLPNKVPPKKLKTNVMELPMLGYLEQEMSDMIIKAVNEVGCLKPKLPFMSVRKSALVFIASHLKAYNKKSSEFSRKIFLRRLNEMRTESELISYLASNMTHNFKEPPRRPEGFDEKMETFLNCANTKRSLHPLQSSS